MGLFGDLGRMARELKDIGDEFVSLKDDVVSSTRDLAKEALDVKDSVQTNVTETIQSKKESVVSEIKKTITQK
jgi:gas vesicle protein